MVWAQWESRRLARSCGSWFSLCLAAVPVLGEQIKEDLTPGMSRQHVVVQRHAKAGTGRQRKISVNHLWVARRRAFDEVFREIVEVLLDLEVRRTRGKVQIGGGGYRAAHVVGCDQDVVRIGPGRQLLGLEDAAEVGDVGLDNVGGLQLE